MDVTGNVIAERFASSYFEYDVDILIASCNSDVILTMPSIHAASHGWRSVIERTRHLMRYLCHLTEQIMPYVDEQEEKLRGSLVWGSPNLVIREQLRINPDGKVIEIHRELQERPTVQPKLVDRAAVAELRDQLIHHMSLIDSVDVVKGTVLHSGPRNGGASPRITFLSTPRGARSFPHVADKEDLSRVLAADHHVFPVADFSFCDLNKVEDLLTAIPRLGQRLPVQEVLREIIPTEATLMAAAAQLVHPKSSSQVAAEQDKGNRLVVKAKSRGGDAVAYEFDRTEQEQAAQARVKDRQMDGRRMNRGGPDDNHEKQCQRTRFRTHAIRLGANNLGLDIASKEGGANRAPFSTLTLPMALRRIIQDAVLTLTWIDFSDNHLTTIPDLSAFPISILNLQQNNICDIREVWKVRCLPLISLNLFGNPLDGIRNYKVRVLDILISSKPIHTVKPLEMKELPHRSMEVRKLDNVPLSRGDRTHLISHRMLERTSTRT